MTVSKRPSPYETLVAIRPQLLARPADIGAVSLLGQAVSDVLDDDGSESAVLQLIADLEAARSSADAATINKRWALPLASILGLLRQHLHNRNVQEAAVDPSSVTLRDKVLAALDAGVDTPTAIGQYVRSPATVVSRVLRQLAAQGRVELAEGSEDKRRRPYRRVVEAEPEVDQVTAAAFEPAESAESAPARGIADVEVLIDFAEHLTRCNPKMASSLLPNLIEAGSDTHLSPSLRVSALSVAGIVVRAVGGANAGDDALDLAETADAIAGDSEDDLLRARAAYDRTRAVLFAMPNEIETALGDLQRAEGYVKGDWRAEAQIRLGWCAYTRCLIEDARDLALATKHAERALNVFRRTGFDYGTAAALTLLTRERYRDADWKGAADYAMKALSIANSNGYLRLMAESSFWAADLLSEEDPQRADQLVTTAGQLFEAVGSPHWSALSYASREVSKVRRDPMLPPKKAAELLEQLVKLQGEEMSAQDNSWAAAVLNRWIAVCARYAHRYEFAVERFDTSVEQYTAAAYAPGLAMAKVGRLATERRHSELERQDLADALEVSAVLLGEGKAPQAAVGALEHLGQGTIGEFGAI